MTTPASRGRERLAEIKAAHVVDQDSGPMPPCRECNYLFPCDAARLIAAVELALLRLQCNEARDECRCDDSDEVLAKLAEPQK